MKFSVTFKSGKSSILTVQVISQSSTAFRLGKPSEKYEKFIMFIA